jgi:uncharacterized protein (TIGR03067 family)
MISASTQEDGTPVKQRLALCLVVLLAASLMTHAEPRPETPLQGRWHAVEASSNGEPPPAGLMERLTLAFEGETVSTMGAPPTRFTIDSSVTPAHIDFLNSRHQVGIYELKGDTLKICIGMDGDRPASFQTEKHTDHTYMLLKRTGG